MKTLIKPYENIEIKTFDHSFYKGEKKLINTKLCLDFKFYQKFLLIILASFSFVLFPESPIDSEVLCKKYHSADACIIW